MDDALSALLALKTIAWKLRSWKFLNDPYESTNKTSIHLFKTAKNQK